MADGDGKSFRSTSNDAFKVGDRVFWHARWLNEKRTGTVRALHRPGTYILDLDKPLPAPHRGSRTVAFGYELEALSEVKLLHRLDPAFERFMRVVLRPVETKTDRKPA